MSHNFHAKNIIETLYRNMRNNFFFENFSFNQDDRKDFPSPSLAHPLKPQNQSSFREQTESQQNLSSKTGNQSQLDKLGISSNASMHSFTLGNNSSLYLSDQSNFNGSLGIRAFRGRKSKNGWEISDEKCF